MRAPRVAFFPDSFHEVNGVAHTSQNFVAFAERHGLPMLCVRAGARERAMGQQGSVQSLELPRSSAAVGVEKDLAFDPLFWRHADAIEDALRRFRPDLLHLTGPNELGIFAAYFSWKLEIPLAASWHTNVHEYAARRLTWLTKKIGNSAGAAAGRGIEAAALKVAQHFYGRAEVLFAPNEELTAQLSVATGKPCRLMQRGVDTQLFNPARRTRPAIPKQFRLGFVGRLSVEKNVALLPLIQRELDTAGVKANFILVGHGAEEAALRKAMPNAEFTGVLRAEALADAYADMDLLVFPSHTDTFGNVVLEALASGVPAIVTHGGGPKFIVRESTAECVGTGVVANDDAFASKVVQLLRNQATLSAMRVAAREAALGCSWDAVFAGVYEAYGALLASTAETNSAAPKPSAPAARRARRGLCVDSG